jgi:hypothetical protein
MTTTPSRVSILEAVEQGRAGRGRHGSQEWSRLRAEVLTHWGRGLTRARIGGMMGFSSQRVTQLREEACDAVLRGGADSDDACAACAATWRRWCEERGDREACGRLRKRRK